MSMIARHIAYLLRNHDCVVAPGIGAFIAQHINARIDTESNLMYPPSRMLGFNAEISHDDGLLASSIARQMGITYQQVQKTVATEMDALRCQLVNTGEIALPRIGTLHREPDGRITFEPFADNVVSTSYLGLCPVNVTAIKPAAGISKKPEEALTVCPSAYRRWLKVAASVAVLLFMGGLLSTPVDLTDTQLASLGITVNDPQDTSEGLPAADFELNQPSPAACLNIAIPRETTAEKPPRITTETDSRHANYYLIVASLPTEQLAEKFIATDGNPDLGILKKDGRYRVYAASGSTQAETMALLHDDDLSTRYPGAWVCGK